MKESKTVNKVPVEENLNKIQESDDEVMSSEDKNNSKYLLQLLRVTAGGIWRMIGYGE